jgi:ABC-type uncharacterized transport system substrate-binding protein
MRFEEASRWRAHGWSGALVLGLTLSPLASEARAAEVVLLRSADVEVWRPAVESVMRGLAAHSVEDYDLRQDAREADRLAASLQGRDVIVVAFGPLAAKVARTHLSDRPLVYALVQDPAGLGLLAAGNVAGVAAALPAKIQLAAFRSLHPGAVRIGVLYHQATGGRQVAEAREAARVLRLELVAQPVSEGREVPAALRRLLEGPSPVDALWLPADAVVMAEDSRRHILWESLKANKPVLTVSAAIVSEGALASHSPDYSSVGEQAAEAVRRIASGEAPRAIGLLVPRGQLTVNRKIADRLRLGLREEVMSRSRIIGP